MASVPSSCRASWMACSTELAKYDLILIEELLSRFRHPVILAHPTHPRDLILISGGTSLCERTVTSGKAVSSNCLTK